MGSRQGKRQPKERVEDTFSKTWGADTKWKTSRKFGAGEQDDLLQASVHPGSPQCEPQLHKPLPPTPTQTIDRSANRTEDLVEQLGPQNAIPRPSTSSRASSLVSIFRLARRLGVYRRSRITNQPPLDAQTTADLVEQQPCTPSRNYEDKGTQTIDDLLEVKSRWRSFIGLPHHSYLHGSENGSIHSDSKPSPLWSPRRFLATTGPGDYFLSSMISEKKGSPEFSSRQSESSNGTQIRVPIADSHSLPSPGHFHKRSKDSLGSYESRYSSRIIENVQTAERPVLTRKANSESVLLTDPKGIPDASDRITSSEAGAVLHNNRESIRTSVTVTQNQQAPRPQFQGNYSFKGRSRYRSPSYRRFSKSLSPFTQDSTSPGSKNRSNCSTPSSSLRQELRLQAKDEEKITEVGSSSPDDYFHLPVATTTPPRTPGLGWDIPDHLMGSPLCPRHPKHRSGGTGVCPLHGRNKTSLSDSSGSRGSLDSPRKVARDIELKKSADPHMPGEFQDGAFAFDFVDNSGSEGDGGSFQTRRNWIYLFHAGWLKGVSEDSIPRIPIR